LYKPPKRLIFNGLDIVQMLGGAAKVALGADFIAVDSGLGRAVKAEPLPAD
jgi:hypothetical protein